MKKACLAELLLLQFSNCTRIFRNQADENCAEMCQNVDTWGRRIWNRTSAGLSTLLRTSEYFISHHNYQKLNT